MLIYANQTNFKLTKPLILIMHKQTLYRKRQRINTKGRIAHRLLSIHRGRRISSLEGELSPRVAQAVPPFVAAGSESADSVPLVIRCEAGTGGTERRAKDEPTIPSRVRRKRVPRTWCPPFASQGPPYPSAEMTSKPVDVRARRPASFMAGRVWGCRA